MLFYHLLQCCRALLVCGRPGPCTCTRYMVSYCRGRYSFISRMRTLRASGSGPITREIRLYGEDQTPEYSDDNIFTFYVYNLGTYLY